MLIFFSLSTTTYNDDNDDDNNNNNNNTARTTTPHNDDDDDDNIQTEAYNPTCFPEVNERMQIATHAHAIEIFLPICPAMSLCKNCVRCNKFVR